MIPMTIQACLFYGGMVRTKARYRCLCRCFAPAVLSVLYIYG